MTKEELYNISDGDLGSTVASGLKRNFEGIIDDVSSRVPKQEGKGLSSNDYTDEDKQSLANKQNKTDNSLQTESKTVTGAINEVKASADASASQLGDVQGVLEKINNETL